MAVMNRVLCYAMVSLMVIAVASALVGADAAPIAGTVKSVDPAAGTFVVQSTSRGKTREVVIHMRPASKVVRFVRSTDATKPGFNEQPAALGDLKVGWTVSVKTKHEGDKEVAELVKVVHEQ